MNIEIPSSPKALFNGLSEIVFLTFPLIAVAYVWFIFPAHIAISDYQESKNDIAFFIDIFFLGTVHTVFTFWILFQNKNAQTWIQKTNRRHQNNFWVHIGLLALLLCTVFAIYYKIIPVSQTVFSVLYSIVTVFIAVLIPFHHSLFQMLGISLLYGQKQSSAEKTPADPTKPIEKKLFKIFYIVLIIPFLIFQLKSFDIIQVNQKYIYLFNQIASSVLFFILFLILWNQSNSFRKINIHRFFFTLRLGLFAIMPLYQYIYLAIAAIHGVEYAFLVKKLMPKAHLKFNLVIAIFSLLALVGLGILIRTGRYLSSVLESQTNVSVFLSLLAVMTYVVQYLHIHIDSELFKMQNIESREFSKKLIE